MGQHRQNPRAAAARQPTPQRQRPDRELGCGFTTAIVPKAHVIMLPPAQIRRLPALVDGGAEKVEIFGRKRRQNQQTGAVVEDAEPAWHALEADQVAWPDNEAVPHKLCDIVVMPISIVTNPKLVNMHGQARQSQITLPIYLARVDCETLLAAHERNLMGTLAEMPGADAPKVEPGARG
jgi:hypothetical protein